MRSTKTPAKPRNFSSGAYDIRIRLMMAFSAVIVALLLVTAYVFAMHFVIVNKYKTIVENTVSEYHLIEATTDLIESYNRLFMDIRNPQRMENYRKAHDEIRYLFSRLDHTIQNEESRDLYVGAKRTIESVMSETDGGLDSILKGEISETSAHYTAAHRKNIFVYDNVASLILKELEHAEKLQKNIQTTHRLSLILGSILVFFMGCGCVVFSITFSNKLVAPVLALAGLAKTIAGGNLEVRVDDALLRQKDELGSLSNSFDIMISNLRSNLAQRKADEEKIRLSEEHYRALFELSPDAIYINKEGRINFANTAFMRLVGAERLEQIIGKDVLEIVHPDYHGLIRQRTHALKENKTGSSVPTAEQKIIRLDGTVMDVESSASSFIDQGERVFLVIWRDITEQKRMEKIVLQSEKMAAVGQLAGGVAHDFNNLLTVINGYTKLSIESLPKDDPMRADLEEIQKAGLRAAELVSKLLVFSRRNVVQFKVISLNELILGMNAMLRRLVPANVEYMTLPTGDSTNVRIDVASFEQVLVNLVVNAVHAMPDGGRLIVETKKVFLDEAYHNQYPEVAPGEYVLLAVSDTGTGMSDQVKSHLFEPFFTTKGTGKGTGLGLATSYSVINKNGGHIQVQSKLGGGTTFEIYLPRVHDKAANFYDTEKQDDLPRGTETILVVEDETAVRQFTVRILNAQGYRTFEASNGEEALRFLEKKGLETTPHLVLTDVVMPQMGGKELSQKLRALFPDLKVVFMSGYAEDLAPEAEGRVFLSKPFTPRALAFKIREVLS